MACSFQFARLLLIAVFSVACVSAGSPTSPECRDSDGAPEELALVQRQASVLSMKKQQQEQDFIEQVVKPTLKFKQRCKPIRQSHLDKDGIEKHGKILLPEGAASKDKCLEACQARSEGIDDKACCQFIGPLPHEVCKAGQQPGEACTPHWMGKHHMDVLSCSYCEEKNHLQHHSQGGTKPDQNKLEACNSKGSVGKNQNGFHFGDCDKETMCWLIIGDDTIVGDNTQYSYAGIIDAIGSVPLPPLPETSSPTDSPTPSPTTPSPTDSPTPSPTTPSPTDSPTPSPTTPSPTDSPTEPTGPEAHTCSATTMSCHNRGKGQVPVCIDGPGCDSKAFSPGAKFCLNGKTLEVDSSWNSGNGCQTRGATVNFFPNVYAGCSTKDVITFGACEA